MTGNMPLEPPLGRWDCGDYCFTLDMTDTNYLPSIIRGTVIEVRWDTLKISDLQPEPMRGSKVQVFHRRLCFHTVEELMDTLIARLDEDGYKWDYFYKNRKGIK